MNDAILFSPKRHVDRRGYFSETYSLRDLQARGVEDVFVQENESVSISAGTLRGLHFQSPPFSQAKLVRCTQGKIYDVIVDIRKGSPHYGQWSGWYLSEENRCQLYVPHGFAHGFVTLEANTKVIYKCSSYYEPKAEGAIHWDDKELDIDWPLVALPIVSDKDDQAENFGQLDSPFVWASLV